MDIQFSIVVPVFNVEEYLVRCIESVLSQDYFYKEILLIDDGSTDKSGEICDAYHKDYPNQVKVIHKKNSGLSHTRNLGIMNASGDYILFLDSDDYWEGDFLSELNTLLSIPYDVVISGGFNYLYNHEVIRLRHPFSATTFQGLKGDEALLKFVESSTRRWAVWQNIYRRDYLITNALFFPDGKLCEDVDWTYRVFLFSERTAFFEPVFYQYIADREDSIMNSPTLKRWQDLMEHCVEWLKSSKAIELEPLKQLIREIYSHQIYVNLKQIADMSGDDRKKAINWLTIHIKWMNPWMQTDLKVDKRIKRLGLSRYIHLLRIKRQLIRKSIDFKHKVKKHGEKQTNKN